MDVLDMAAVFAGVTHTGSLVMDMEGTVQQATGELEGNSEEVGRVVYTMLQDANSISSAQKVPSESFQRLSVSFAAVEYVAAIEADYIFVIQRAVVAAAN